MRHLKQRVAVFLVSGLAAFVFAQLNQPDQAKLQQYRNLGKAFYENPTTQKELWSSFARHWRWRRLPPG
jgi:hypothetical protein